MLLPFKTDLWCLPHKVSASDVRDMKIQSGKKIEVKHKNKYEQKYVPDKYIRDAKIQGRKKSETTKHMFEETTQKCELYVLMFGTSNDSIFSKIR